MISGRALQKELGLAFKFQSHVLMRRGASERGDSLYELKHALGQPAVFVQDGGDHLRGLGLAETLLAQKGLAVLILAGDYPLMCRLDAGDERCGRRPGEARQRWRRLMGKALRGEFAVPDADLLEALDAPKIAVHADGA